MTVEVGTLGGGVEGRKIGTSVIAETVEKNYPSKKLNKS